MTARCDNVRVGYVSGLHGVGGWVKIFSYTDPPRNIFEYQPWILELASDQRVTTLVDARPHGAGLIAKLEGIDDRDDAAALIGGVIFVGRQQLPAPGPDEYYWADLVGLEVVTVDGQKLGTVERLFETGANDVLVVNGDRQRLIPWIADDVVAEVDLAEGRITVVWDSEF